MANPSIEPHHSNHHALDPHVLSPDGLVVWVRRFKANAVLLAVEPFQRGFIIFEQRDNGFAGAGVTPDNETVLWQRDAKRARWFALLRSGTAVGGRTVVFETGGQMYWHGTGGGDGRAQSLNDKAELGLLLEFTDGTEGTYLAAAHALGDFDTDGDVDLMDFAGFQECYSGEGNPTPPQCDASDLDGDGDVDLEDFNVLVENYIGPS